MDKLGAEFQLVETAALNRIAHLRGTPALVLASTRDQGHMLSGHFEASLDAIEAEVHYQRVAFDGAVSDVVRTVAVREVRRQNRLINGLEEMRSWLEAHPRLVKLPIGASQLLEQAAAAIVPVPCELIPYPGTPYAYSSNTDPLRGFMGRQTGRGGGALSVVLSYPRQEAERVFFHVLLVHELGHAADYHLDLVSEVNRLAQYNPPRVSGATNQLESIKAADDLNNVRTMWVREALCDSIGLSYFGPGYIYAFAAFVLRYQDSRPGWKHPSTRLRLRLLLEYAVELGWGDFLNRRSKALCTWLSEVAGDDSNRGVMRLYLDAEGLLLDVRGHVREMVSNHLAHAACDPDTHDLAVGRVVSLMQHRVLPAEDNRGRLDPRAIITGGWLSESQAEEFGPKQLIDAASNARLQRFLAKAVEMSVLASRWSDIAAGLPEKS